MTKVRPKHLKPKLPPGVDPRTLDTQQRRILEGRVKPGANATLSFVLGKTRYTHALWVTSLEQPHQLQGTTQQSRRTQHFYPTSYSPGNLDIKGRCYTTEEYQALANFVRYHQEVMIDSPGLSVQGPASTKGFSRLLRFKMTSEQRDLHGWVERFRFTKTGVLAVAPEFEMSFFVAYDGFSKQKVVVSAGSGIYNPQDWKPVKGRVGVVGHRRQGTAYLTDR